METKTISLFEGIIWGGACVSIVGLVGILWCIVKVARAKRADLDDEALQSVMQSVLPMNLGALFLSVIGLMMVGVGIAFS